MRGWLRKTCSVIQKPKSCSCKHGKYMRLAIFYIFTIYKEWMICQFLPVKPLDIDGRCCHPVNLRSFAP